MINVVSRQVCRRLASFLCANLWLEKRRRARRTGTRRSSFTCRDLSIGVERAECRILLTANLFIDYGDNFPGGILSTTQGALRDVANDAVPGNRILGVSLGDNSGFNAATALNIVAQSYNATDRAEALAIVQRAYFGLDINVVELTSTSQTTADGRVVQGATSMTDVINTLRGGNTMWKDAYMFVATFIADPGGPNQRVYGGGGGGLSPDNTLGETSDLNSASNLHDDVAVVYDTGTFFSNNTINNISHEAGHNFGLRHAITTAITSNPHNTVTPAAINLFHEADTMSYRNTNNTTSSVAFTRFPTLRGDTNSPASGILGSYNDISARAGQVTNHDQLRLDGNVGANPDFHFVSGTGAHDIITITKSGSNAAVTIEAFSDAARTIPIIVPGESDGAYSYSIPLTKDILVQAGGSNDEIIIVGDLGVNIQIDGMLGIDDLTVYLPSNIPQYVPRAAHPSVDLDNTGTPITDHGGVIVVGQHTITANNFDLTSTIIIIDTRLQGTAGNDVFVLTYLPATVTITNGATNIGIFPITTPISLSGMGGTDSVELVGTSGNDEFRVTGSGVQVNNSGMLSLSDTDSLLLRGQAGDDTYQFDTDSNLNVFGPATLAELTGGGTDSVNFSPTDSKAVVFYLWQTQPVVVNSNLSLQLSSDSTFENLTGGSLGDTLVGNALDNLIVGGPGNDTLYPNQGNDTLRGGPGDDWFTFSTATSSESDSIEELPAQGKDTLNFSSVSVPLTISLNSDLGQNIHTNRTLLLNSNSTFEDIWGGSSNDMITGNDQNNAITGNDGNDTLFGLGGSDKFYGGAGNDTYVFQQATSSETEELHEYVNQGIDSVKFTAVTVPLTVTLNAVTTQTIETNRMLKLNSAITFENLEGGTGLDFLTGNSLNNTISGNGGNDTLSGLGGDDLLYGGLGNDTYMFLTATSAESDTVNEYFEQGTDILNFSSITTNLNVNLYETTVLTIHANRDLKLNSGVTFENLVGGSGNDTLTGNDLHNNISGNGGNDTLSGLAGNDVINGNDGADVLIGNAGNDGMSGGNGDDTYEFFNTSAADSDTVFEYVDPGIDTLRFAAFTSNLTLSLNLNTAQTIHTNNTSLTLNSANTFENIIGGSGNDILTGNGFANVLVGRDGNDTLNGGNGRDILIGGLGLDTINGGADDDILIAGFTSHDLVIANLIEISLAWSSTTADYQARLANLRSGVGVGNNVSLKASGAMKNVFSDSSADNLTGSTQNDWFFSALDDLLTDLLGIEENDII